MLPSSVSVQATDVTGRRFTQMTLASVKNLSRTHTHTRIYTHVHTRTVGFVTDSELWNRTGRVQQVAAGGL